MLECAILQAKENAPETPEQSESETLADIEQACVDDIKEDLADRLGIDKELMDGVKPPSEQ